MAPNIHIVQFTLAVQPTAKFEKIKKRLEQELVETEVIGELHAIETQGYHHRKQYLYSDNKGSHLTITQKQNNTFHEGPKSRMWEIEGTFDGYEIKDTVEMGIFSGKAKIAEEFAKYMCFTDEYGEYKIPKKLQQAAKELGLELKTPGS